jgi:MFS family permease
MASTILPTPAPLTHRETRLVIFGVLLPVFMGSLDNTILASALPSIGREYRNAHDLPWLITTYMIASTAALPLYGKISDIRGRRFTVLIALAIHMAGSLACALAPNMFVLILGRIVQGLGGGGLSATGMVVLGDIAAPKDRGRYYGYFSFTYTTAGASGPALGGFLSDYLHWSAIFWLNIPMGLLALALTQTLLRRLPRHERPHRLDFIGAGLIVTASVAAMLALSTGGVRFSWTSLPILTLAALALAIGIGFVLRLLTAPEPLIPLNILSDPVARLAISANAFGWGSIIGLNIFLPMYLQNVAGFSATTAGLSLMIIMATLNVSAGVAGYLIGHMTHYKLVPMLGLLLAIGAVLLLAIWAQGLSLWRLELILALIGIGFGGIPPLTAVSLQNTVPNHQLGSAIGTMSFSRGLFATMIVAIFGAIVLAGGPVDPQQIASGIRFGIAGTATDYSRVFLAAAGSLAVAFVALLLMEERPLQTRRSG